MYWLSGSWPLNVITSDHDLEHRLLKLHVPLKTRVLQSLYKTMVGNYNKQGSHSRMMCAVRYNLFSAVIQVVSGLDNTVEWTVGGLRRAHTQNPKENGNEDRTGMGSSITEYSSQ